MKGVIFIEFLESAEERYGTRVVERVVAEASLTTRGAYSAIGTYDHREFLHLVSRLSGATGNAPSQLLKEFGRWLFHRLVHACPRLMSGVGTAQEFLERLAEQGQAEIQQLCHETELPRIDVSWMDDEVMEIQYASPRPLADLAEGMLEGCCDHFGHTYVLERDCTLGQVGTAASFVLTCPARAEACTTPNP